MTAPRLLMQPCRQLYTLWASEVIFSTAVLSMLSDLSFGGVLPDSEAVSEPLGGAAPQMMNRNGDPDALNVTLVERLLTPWAMVRVLASSGAWLPCLSRIHT